MSTSLLLAPVRSMPILARAAAYVELTKPKIAMMVLVAVAAAASIASWRQPTWAVLHALLGTLLVAASSCAANQWLERFRDGLMERTADRPLPQGRLSSAEVVAFVTITLVAGLVWLSLFTTLLTAAIALLTWSLYVAVYTPLKTRTSLNTAVGAIPGALPVLIGWTCVEGPLNLRAAGLFLTLFVWQFPHFMAIAWLYRKQYAQAGFRMLPTVDRTGVWSGVQAVTCALLLIPVSLVPVLSLPGNGALAYAIAAIVLGLLQFACAAAFAWRRDDICARRLLRASLIYLPVLLGCLVAMPGVK
jgi:protoheme IX farnesyltransferase